MKVHCGLVVDVGGEGLRLGRWNGAAARNQALDHAAHHLESQAERHDVEEQHVLRDLALTGQDVRLECGAECNHLVGVEVAVRRASEELGDECSHQRYPCRAADQDHLIDVGGGNTRIGDGALTGLAGSGHDGTNQVLEARAIDLGLNGGAIECGPQRGVLGIREVALGLLRGGNGGSVRGSVRIRDAGLIQQHGSQCLVKSSPPRWVSPAVLRT